MLTEKKLVQAITDCILNIPNIKSIVIAFSGGIDSQVLAYGVSLFAKKYPNINYLLMHVHHGLSVNANTWAEHCEQSADNYNLPIKIQWVKVPVGSRLSLEAEARRVRYDALKSTMESGDVLMTGHHQDDLVETVLLALKRGLGPKGLSGMGKVQKFNKDKFLIRPLLDFSKDEILEFAKSNNIKHINDESNDNTAFDRNFLRIDIIKKLKKRWPAFSKTVSRSAYLCAQQEKALEFETKAKLVHVTSGNALVIDKFRELALLWQPLILRAFIDENDAPMPSMGQLDQMLMQFTSESNLMSVRWGDFSLRQYQGHAYIIKKHAKMPTESLSINIFQKTNILNNDYSLFVNEANIGDRLRCPLISEKVTVRFGAKGSTICHPSKRGHSRELKKLWQEYKVPPWERFSVPLIFYDEKLVCAVGLWIDINFIEEDKKGLIFKLGKNNASA